MKKWYLKKGVPMTVYFKCKDQTGHTNTSSINDAMTFDSKEEAIDYNHKWLYGDYETFNQ